MRRMCLFLLHNKLNLGAIFDAAGRKISSTIFSDERYWDYVLKLKKQFNINFSNVISHKK